MSALLANLRRNRPALFGVVVAGLLITLALIANLLPIQSPGHVDLRSRLSSPSFDAVRGVVHLLGTDQIGRDMLARLVYASRTTLGIAATAVLLGAMLGSALGLVAGYAGRTVDMVIMRIVDMQLAIPLMLVAVLLVAVLSPGIENLIIVLALVAWTRFARIVRGDVLSLREREFVLAARAAGAGPWRIMFRHILPNVVTSIISVAMIEFARIVLVEAALSFLGLGVQPPMPSWGRMLFEGRSYLATAWWITALPGLAIMLTILSVNLVGDWLRDQFDPRAAK